MAAGILVADFLDGILCFVLVVRPFGCSLGGPGPPFPAISAISAQLPAYVDGFAVVSEISRRLSRWSSLGLRGFSLDPGGPRPQGEAPKHINSYGLVTCMAPNLIGDIHGPKHYKFSLLGDIHGPNPYKLNYTPPCSPSKIGPSETGGARPGKG